MAKLKITDKDYALLRDMFLLSHKADLYERYQELGLTDKRYQWDMIWNAPQDMRKPFFDSAYQYMNDDHIDSALRHIHSNSI